MSKMSELDRILQELKKCGESLACIAEELAEVFSGSGGAEDKKESGGAEERKEAGGKPGKKETAAKTSGQGGRETAGKASGRKGQEAEKQYSLTEVRAILAEKSRAGFTAEVRGLLAKHGADKLSGIDPSEYAALVADVEVL